MFHFQFQCFIQKTLREKNKNTVGAIQNLCGSDSKTLWERESAPSVFLNRSHRGFESLPQCFCFSPTVFLV